MKKILTILIFLHISHLLWAADNEKGVYVARFSVEYKNVDYELRNNSKAEIWNYLELTNRNNKSITFQIFNTSFPEYSYCEKEINIKEDNFEVKFYADISGKENSVRVEKMEYYQNIKYINIKPFMSTIGKGNFKIYIKNTFTGNTTSKTFTIDYNLEIRPKEIKCDSIEKTDNENLLLYEEPICIQATKGFPKEVYKWRYSYKNANGVTIEGNLYPYKTEDNGATIYVKGSDFLSVSTFHDLVYREEAISIIPDGAEEYNKPLSVEGVNLTAKPSAPLITNVTFKKPICSNVPAQDITVYFDRPIAKGESFSLQFYNQDAEQVTVPVTSKNGDKYVHSELIAGEWNVHYLNSRYINKNGEEVSSYSDGQDRLFHFTITAPDPITINNISSTTTSCIGRADGSISCEVTGGTGEKICSLYRGKDKYIPNGTIQDGKFIFTGLSKGSYYIEATDKNGCISEKSNSIEILEPEPLKIEVSDITNLQCFGDSDGVISYATSGGTGNKTVFLKYPNGYVKENDEDSNSFSGLSAGTYYLSATDENGCVTNKDTEFKISEPDSLWLELTTTDATIFGNCNGTLSASFGGGTTGSYKLEVTDETITSFFPELNKPLSSDLCAGESEVTLIDGNNCTTTKKYIINQPDPLTAKVIQVDTIKCYGESTASLIVDSIKGGIPPYNVVWNNDILPDEDREINHLPAEEYKVKVTDSMGAEIELYITIDQPKRLELRSSDITPAFCSGDSTGNISLIAEGGTLPYKFFLEDTLSTSGEYASLPAGTYTARVEDKNNCFTENLFTIETLSTLTAKISAESPKCDYLNDGFIDLYVDNGLEPYKITWYADDKVLKEDIFKMSELSAGEYSVIVQDAAGCVEKVDTTLYQPAKLEIELPEKLYLCIDQYYPITLENTRIDSAVWYFKDKEYSKSLKTRLRKEGLYNLDIAYDKYCHEYKTIKVDTINKSVKANFLVAEEIPVHDDAHLINITSKEDYDYVEWVYPENDAWVYGEDEYLFQLVFLNEGTFQVGMISHKDKCEASLFKTIKTFTPEKGIAIEENSYNITQLSIDKSPNNGTFTAHIELSAKADVILYLYNASTGHIVDVQEAKKNKTYDIPFSVTTIAGEYILLLIVPEWEKSSWIKMLII